MSGASVEIQVSATNKKIAAALKRLARRTDNLRPVMERIGVFLENSVLRRFETQTAPDGTPWLRSERAELEHGQTLTDTGRLRASITRVVESRSTAVGTNVVYAAIHQFGGTTPARVIKPRRKKALFWPGARHPVKSVNHPGSEIGARPFLGLSGEDEQGVLDIINNYISSAIA